VRTIFEIPSIMSPDRAADNLANTWRAVAELTDADIAVADRIDTIRARGSDMVFLIPRKHLARDVIENTMLLCDLPGTTKLILYLVDIECPTTRDRYDVDRFASNLFRLIDRADLLLVDAWDFLKSMYPSEWTRIRGKAIFWPKHVTKVRRYAALQPHPDPVRKCLVCGKLTERYPFRQRLLDGLGDMAGHLSHPGYGDATTKVVGDAFAAELNRHACVESCIWTKCLLEKHVLVPAAWSVLVAEDCEDMRRAGFVPWVHYVPATPDTVVEVVRDLLNGPIPTKIRQEGHDFVMANHTIQNRLEQLEEALCQ